MRRIDANIIMKYRWMVIYQIKKEYGKDIMNVD